MTGANPSPWKASAVKDQNKELTYIFMVLAGQALLLFVLNALDALLTLYWVRNGMATEGNTLMATLLDMGDLPFLGVKFAVGAVTAFTLWHYGTFKLAKYGVRVALAVYVMIMGAHVLTGIFAYGYLSEFQLHEVAAFVAPIISFLG